MHNHAKEIVREPISQRMRAGKVHLHPGHSVGEHIPFEREELVIVTKGVATIIVEGVAKKVAAGEAIFIPENAKHDVRNETQEAVEYVYSVCMLGKR